MKIIVNFAKESNQKAKIMKRLISIMAAGLVAVTSFSSYAGGFDYDPQALNAYNRVGISYNNTDLWNNWDDPEDTPSLNGFGIWYTHGFHLTEKLPMYLEVGGGFNFLFYGESEKQMGLKVSSTNTLISLEAPVNYLYRFNLGDDWTIAPFIGLNLKLHLAFQNKVTAKYGSQKESETYSYFSSDDTGGDTWNRFQMGWQTGVGMQYKPLYFGISYGTDFIPFYSHDGDWVNTGVFKLNIGYTF